MQLPFSFDLEKALVGIDTETFFGDVPDDEEFGPTGNEGCRLEYFYRKAALLLVPKKQLIPLWFSCGDLARAIPLLKDVVCREINSGDAARKSAINAKAMALLKSAVAALLGQQSLCEHFCRISTVAELLDGGRAIVDSILAPQWRLELNWVPAIPYCAKQFGVDFIRPHLQRMWGLEFNLPVYSLLYKAIALNRELHGLPGYRAFEAELLHQIREGFEKDVKRGCGDSIVLAIDFLSEFLSEPASFSAFLQLVRHHFPQDVNNRKDVSQSLLHSKEVWRIASQRPLVKQFLEELLNERLVLLAVHRAIQLGIRR